MSNKPRRDITLGEMQDECKKRDGACCGMDSWESCKFFKVCPFQMQSRKALGWDLSNPPRFNEAQMALLKGFMAIGAVSVQEVSGWFAALDKDGKQINLARALRICGETIDLTEVPMEDKG